MPSGRSRPSGPWLSRKAGCSPQLQIPPAAPPYPIWTLRPATNNFYEFSLDKQAVARLARDFKFRPWQVEVKGLVEKPLKFDVDDLIRRMKLEERVLSVSDVSKPGRW